MRYRRATAAAAMVAIGAGCLALAPVGGLNPEHQSGSAAAWGAPEAAASVFTDAPEPAPPSAGTVDADAAPPASGTADDPGSTAPAGAPQPAEAPPAAPPLDLHWPEPTLVNHVSIVGPDDPAAVITRAALSFSDGSSLHLVPDADGSIDVDFPQRLVTAASLTILEAAASESSAPLSHWSVDDSGSPLASAAAVPPVAQASSNAGGEGALAFSDGNPATGSTGNEWAPNPMDRHPSVALSWPSPLEIASVQVFGPSETFFDPAYSAAAALHGELVFDDGSVVKVSGIAGGESQPTTIAFMPRMTTSVELRLHPTIGVARPGLREFTAYPAGTTPPRWKAPAGPGYATQPPAVQHCGHTGSASGTTTDSSLALLCPTPGASVTGTATILVKGHPGTVVDATARLPLADGSARIGTVASSTAASNGIATLLVDTARLEHGPTALKVVYRAPPSAGAATPLYVQLYNLGGRTPAPVDHSPPGMTLQWSEEFSSPLSATHWGDGAVYAATKPAYWGSATFGEAVLVDPAANPESISTLGGEYLRIRAEPSDPAADPNGWNRRHTSGILSSLRVGATGFSAQYGYFEARMLAPAGKGTWPAFWMLNSESATKRGAASEAEVDAVELYGHDSTASCHAMHHWTDGEDAGDIRCLWPNGHDDWALSWHTYGVRIKPGAVEYFIDGVRVARLTGLAHEAEPFYFMLNLALGGGYPIALEGTSDVVDLYVDSVRVYT
ncbi:family 16 glycosylhydrolase [Lysobacter korlensis]|uniref:Family 16 glycosylhydrolase n=1 Tax=Lysobacter korlensis TaxID=553636 RepID=A0ABV6RWQ6_9GAMM